MPIRSTLGPVGDAGDHGHEVVVDLARRFSSGSGAGEEFVDGGDDPCDEGFASLRGGAVVLDGGLGVVQRDLVVHGERGERSAQFVAHILHEALLDDRRLFEPVEHGIEAVGERLGFGGLTSEADAAIERSRLYLLGDAGDVLHRGGRPT
jgi:hypothetical protein